jgi:hypothetical protein
VRWAGQAAHVERKFMLSFAGTFKENKPLRTLMCKWKYNMENDLK